MIDDAELPLRAKKKLRELEEISISEDLQLLETDFGQSQYRRGYQQYLKSPQHDIEMFLDQLESARRKW